MGASVQADCVCGFTSGILMIGGGMASFTTLCAFPGYCPTCRKLWLLNLFDKPLCCPECGGSGVLPYDNSQLIGKAGCKQVVSWDVSDKLGRALILTDGDYLCPGCQRFTLHFRAAGIIWD